MFTLRFAARRAAAAASVAAGGALLQQGSSWPSLHARCDSKPDAGSAASLLQQSESAVPLLFCWGRLVPQSGTTDESAVRVRERSPVDVKFWTSRGLRVQQMSFGAKHGAALDDGGKLWVWGESAGPEPVALPCRSTIAKVASTDNHLYAVTSSGAVLEWRDVDSSLSPGGPPPSEPKPMGGALARTRAVSVAGGAAHVLVVGRAGELVAFGDNGHGQLGLGQSPAELPSCEVPTLLPKLPAAATQAACGANHSVVALADGSCVSFGDDRNYQLGLRKMTIKEMRDGKNSVHAPQRLQALGNGGNGRVVAVAAGGGGVEGGHSLFLVRGEAGDELWACGYGRWGQLGGKAYTHISEPKPLSAFARLRQWDEEEQRVVSVRVAAIGCGERHSAALLATGNAFVWGWNDQGQLGSGGGQGTNMPGMVKSPPELRFTVLRGIACGPNQTAVWT